MSRAARLLSISILAVIAGCTAKTDDSRTTAAQSQALTSDAGPAAASSFTAERFGTAAACPGCVVLHSTRLLLPETKIAAASAKLRAADGTLRAVTIDATGATRDEATLLTNEQTAARTKYGKLRPELSAWVTSASPTDRRWVWIWTDVSLTYPLREDLTTTASASSFRTQVANALDTSVKPVRDFAAKLSGVEFGDASGPMLRARLTAAQVKQVAALAHVRRSAWTSIRAPRRRPRGALPRSGERRFASHRRTPRSGWARPP